MRAFILCCLAIHAIAADPVPRGGRVLSIDVNMAQDQAAANNYDAAWTLATSCGATSVGLSLDWNSIEAASAAPGTATSGVFTDPGGYLAAAEGYYPARGASLVLTLRPLHNSVKPVPGDLSGTAFADAQHLLATRFCAMLDWVVTRMPNTVFEALVIGSEHDVYLAAHGGWSDYGDFLFRVVSHVRASAYSARIPRIASEFTYSTGYVGHPAEVAALNGLCDAAGVSYYAIGADMDALDAATIRSQLDQLVTPATGPFQAAAGKPVCFYQFGCPAAWQDAGLVVHDRSSRQADFIATAFAFWDANPTTVRLMDFTWLHDLSPAELAIQETYFGSSNPTFITFLASLGLRTWPGAGTDRSAFLALQHAARARGWGNHIPVASLAHIATAPGVTAAVTLIASDADLDALTYGIVTGPAHGVLSGVAPALTYTPDPGFTGLDTVVFQAADADALSTPTTVSITVGSGGSAASGGGGGAGGCSAGATGSLLLPALLALGLRRRRR